MTKVMKINRIIVSIALFAFVCPALSGASKKLTNSDVLKSMKAATEYMMNTVSYNGGFVWNYLPDFSRQWGEMEAKRTMVWTQSSTPEVGHVLLDAYHATGDEYYYEMAKKVANALIWGQLDCGGWNYCFDFAGEESLKDWYATVGANGWRLEEFQHYYGNATFDDSASTDCGKFLLRMYVEKYDPAYLVPLEKFINFVLESQYPCGGWPQRYPLMYDHPFQGKADYSSFVTLNDDVIPQCIDFLVQCFQCLGKQGLREPIYRAMYLCITLQQGKPYSGWADQYTVIDLKPAHARSYEPVGINCSTTTRMINQMYKYYGLTGDTRFLSGIPAAIDYLESQALPQSEIEKSGRRVGAGSVMIPRFVDPVTGEPHYVHREGSNVQNGRYFFNTDISNTIGHYSSIGSANIKNLRDQYEKVISTPVEEYTKDSPLLNKGLVPLDKYYTASRAGRGFGGGFGGNFGGGAPMSVEDIIKGYISSQTPQGCWLTPLNNTSNPYAPYEDNTPSHETKYLSTNVGDEHDTSPYSNFGSSVQGISTSDYINKMAVMLHYIAGE